MCACMYIYIICAFLFFFCIFLFKLRYAVFASFFFFLFVCFLKAEKNNLKKKKKNKKQNSCCGSRSGKKAVFSVFLRPRSLKSRGFFPSSFFSSANKLL